MHKPAADGGDRTPIKRGQTSHKQGQTVSKSVTSVKKKKMKKAKVNDLIYLVGEKK